ncbi:hypothetical protein JKF63_06056 [Porcisia hertigi]|uniref:Protein kinase domain-containing protein n=1 Tax=Porcisia hertigi TaxID=2761500 RepID=A0A836LIU2_9TRYP|nr:hypothetical protein JKF63_06056 [Porcisia hertigi]
MTDSVKAASSQVSPEPLVQQHPCEAAMQEEETHAPYEVCAEATQFNRSRRRDTHYGNVAHVGIRSSSGAGIPSTEQRSVAGEPTAESKEALVVNTVSVPTASSSSGSCPQASTSASDRPRPPPSYLSPRTVGEGQSSSLAYHSSSVHADPMALSTYAMASGVANGVDLPAASASAASAAGVSSVPTSSLLAGGPPALPAAPPNGASTTSATMNHPLASSTTRTRTGFSNGTLPPHPGIAVSRAACAAPPSSSHRIATSAAMVSEAASTSSAVGKEGSSTRAGVSTSNEADPYARPAVALSVHLLELYKMVNAQYCAQRRLESPGPKYNNGYDDKDGHYVFLPGEVIFQRYIAQEVLGKGSFGTVIRGFDQKRTEAVAMKITRRGSSFRSQAKVELDILLRLNENPSLNHLVVRLLKVFEWQNHLVLVFELLSFNLYQLIKCTRFKGVSLDLVRKFAYQLTHTLLQLELQKPHPIIHCDLKPENILLRNQNRSGIRLIDFGSACYTAKRFHRYIQSRFYRSPEVILFLEYGTPIDRWSLACVLVELHTGVPLFDGRTEAAQLAKFEATLGPIPAEMVAGSPKANRFYRGSLATGFQLKEPIPERCTLESVIGVTTGGPCGRRLDASGHSEEAYREFHDFIARFLRYQPGERMSCRDALHHPFLLPLYISDLELQQDRGAAHPTAPAPISQEQQHPQS